ncbi:MAG: hypothetical protein KBS62_02345 [Oscillospiraceae bacterium]|nr:hypothetical protein [Candidatus Ruminococcus equi]
MKINKIKSLLDNEKVFKITVGVLISIVVIIFLSSYVDLGSIFSKNITSEEYCEVIENKLLQVVSQIDGVGEAKIFLTMDNGGENVYLNNSDTKTKSIEPTVRGVVVVCDGGDDANVVSRVLSAVTKSLDISSNKVCVTKLSKQTEE